MRQIVSLLALICVFSGCTPTPKPIVYGTDSCHFCRMTIVDRQYAAQLVTTKGKNYKFDAAECMLNFMEDYPDLEFEYMLVSDYASPGELIDAEGATYLISENLPSPMGANLSAFFRMEDARSTQEEAGGQLFTWVALRKELTRTP